MFKLKPEWRKDLSQKVDAIRTVLSPTDKRFFALSKPRDAVLTYYGKVVAEMLTQREWEITADDLKGDQLPTPLLTGGMIYRIFERRSIGYPFGRYYTLTPKNAPVSDDFKRELFGVIVGSWQWKKITDYVITEVTDFEICQIADEWLRPIKITDLYRMKEVIWPDVVKQFQKSLHGESLELLGEIWQEFEGQSATDLENNVPTAELVAKFQRLQDLNFMKTDRFWYHYQPTKPAAALNLRQVPDLPARIYTIKDIDSVWIPKKFRKIILEQQAEGRLPNDVFWLHATGRTVDAVIPVKSMYDLATQLNLWLRLIQSPKLLTIEEKAELLPVDGAEN